MTATGPILRIFEVQSKPGCAPTLLEKFATTSAAVVKDEPGNGGYFFGQLVASDKDGVMFVSIWKDMAAVQEKFGADWQVSYLPEGYEDLIETCSVRHLALNGQWHADLTAILPT
ncbi:MAG: putative quinol monooxygenase [Rhodospirillaceae bacterium]